ncbi:hypothetical protein CEXT_433321 [Caerostris extrusa]|uniref:Uncharacterized protein n=1 Tax=Caerostris extrusa TaxID=172846 RepID=A0AAV4MJT8_CAEEX|nr:hypothetical protein CEXT_433321 [Caerostris extrusa]
MSSNRNTNYYVLLKSVSNLDPGDENPYLITLVENLNHKYEVPSLRCSGILCGAVRSPGRGSTWTHPCCQIRTTSDHRETWKHFGHKFETRFRSCDPHTDAIAGKTNYCRIVWLYGTEQLLNTSVQLRDI